MLSDRLKNRLVKDRAMTSITLRIPVDVVESMKTIAPLRGFAGYQTLLKSYLSEGLRRQTEQTRVRRSVQKQHLLYHHARDRGERGKSHLVELCGRGCAIGREVQQHFQHIGVARHHPRMKKGIPMHGIFRAQAAEQRIRIGQHLRFEKVIQAQRRVPAFWSWWSFCARRHCGGVLRQA